VLLFLLGVVIHPFKTGNFFYVYLYTYEHHLEEAPDEEADEEAGRQGTKAEFPQVRLASNRPIFFLLFRSCSL
jgi:hypothetical protein